MKVYTIFCDDVRHETNNKKSFIGVYDQTLIVKQFPTLVPKFFIVPHLAFKKGESIPKAIRIQIAYPGGNAELAGTIEDKEDSVFPDDEVMFLINEISPFLIENAGNMEVSVKLDDKKIISAGELLIKQGD